MRSVRVRVLVRAQTHGCPLSVGMLLVCVHDFFFVIWFGEARLLCLCVC